MKTQTYIPNSLLTTNNAKTIKSLKYGVTTYILYLSPHRQNSQNKSVCPMASTGCISACLYGAGHGSMSTVQKGRINKTELFLQDRNLFLKMLYVEISQIQLKHKLEKTDFAIRLNGTSDVSWESFKIADTGKNIFETFKKITFYDYTKNYLRFKKELPKNYRLIFSRSETNEAIAIELIKKGINIAMVFDRLPEQYKGYNVIDGDLSDMRFKDAKGIIVGLKYKSLTGKNVNNQTAFDNGFAIRIKDTSLPLKEAA